jgi:hypothetical protein
MEKRRSRGQTTAKKRGELEAAQTAAKPGKEAEEATALTNAENALKALEKTAAERAKLEAAAPETGFTVNTSAPKECT